MNPTTSVYQVSDLVNEMRRLIETSYPEIWIEGELSSMSTPASGHVYFSLKDEHSQLRCVMFRSRASSNRYKPRSGDLVRVRAKLSVYTARGDLQCIIQHIEEAGEGLLQRRFEELKEKLNTQGLFDAEHKLALPQYPKHIALVTSPTGAAVKDIISTLARRCPGIPVTLYPATVQGNDAAQSLIEALNDVVVHQRCDVIIMGRGGGSLEDLWCFNDETLARAIYRCPIPLVSAVGHEVDVSIADLVADLRAPTPTSAAELISPDNDVLIGQLISLQRRLGQSIGRYLEKQAQRVDMSYRQLQHPRVAIKQNRHRLCVAATRLERSMNAQLQVHSREFKNGSKRLLSSTPDRQIRHRSLQLQSCSKRLLLAQSQTLKTDQQRFQALGNQLHAISPLATLERGFSIVRDCSGKILRDSKDSCVGETVKVDLKSGRLLCEIQDILQ